MYTKAPATGSGPRGSVPPRVLADSWSLGQWPSFCKARGPDGETLLATQSHTARYAAYLSGVIYSRRCRRGCVVKHDRRTRTEYLGTGGPGCGKFERAICKRLGTTHDPSLSHQSVAHNDGRY